MLKIPTWSHPANVWYISVYHTKAWTISKKWLVPDLAGSPLHDLVARTWIQLGRHSTQGHEPARPRRPVTLQIPCASSRGAAGKGLPSRERPHRGRGRTASGPATRGRRAAVRHRSELQGRVAYRVRARHDAGWRTTRPWAEPPSRPSARVLCVPLGLRELADDHGWCLSSQAGQPWLSCSPCALAATRDEEERKCRLSRGVESATIECELPFYMNPE